MWFVLLPKELPLQCVIQNFGCEGDDRSKKPGFWIVRSEGVNSGICIGVARSPRRKLVECWCKCQSFPPLNCKNLHPHLLLSPRNKMER
ncbi:hypothetical protein OIU85_018089 [Salix viminalis]|uniref:Uncharacterized protein n=1 Tax=Salix viminalis TaxID=40686 RepID=A0A9Q0UT07_SALVM|nr:hypothetical protein OIU85_018089 [Salix viminalis]